MQEELFRVVEIGRFSLVDDIKQSIYDSRHVKFELFAEKYRNHWKNDGGAAGSGVDTRVDLHKNF